MMRDTPVGANLNDSDLVMDALWSSPEALVVIHDRYCDEVHDLCWSYLRRWEAAAEVASRTWAAAADRLWQLDAPARLRGWLREVAREQVDAHTRVTADVGPHPLLRELLWDSASGLTNRDRRALSLHLGEGLDGPELAHAIGVHAETCDAVLSRLRARVDRTLGALLVARTARTDCGALDRELQDWDGTVTPAARRRISHHVEGCEGCRNRRDAISPWSLLSAVPVAFAPAQLRDAVRTNLVELAASRARHLGIGDPPDGDPTNAEAGGRAVIDRSRTGHASSHGGRALLVSGSSRVMVALLVAAGVAGTAGVGMSDTAWMAAVRHEARAVGALVVGSGDDPPDDGRSAESPVAPPVAPPGAVRNGRGGASSGGGAVTADGRGAQDRDLPFTAPLDPSGGTDAQREDGTDGRADAPLEFPVAGTAPLVPRDALPPPASRLARAEPPGAGGSVVQVPVGPEGRAPVDLPLARQGAADDTPRRATEPDNETVALGPSTPETATTTTPPDTSRAVTPSIGEPLTVAVPSGDAAAARESGDAGGARESGDAGAAQESAEGTAPAEDGREGNIDPSRNAATHQKPVTADDLSAARLHNATTAAPPSQPANDAVDDGSGEATERPGDARSEQDVGDGSRDGDRWDRDGRDGNRWDRDGRDGDRWDRDGRDGDRWDRDGRDGDRWDRDGRRGDRRRDGDGRRGGGVLSFFARLMDR